MEKLNQFWDIAKKDGAISGYICLLVSVGLLITSFFVPPVGEINSSVLQGVAELFAYASLFKLPNIIASVKDGKSITFNHNGTSITVSAEDENTENVKNEA